MQIQSIKIIVKQMCTQYSRQFHLVGAKTDNHIASIASKGRSQLGNGLYQTSVGSDDKKQQRLPRILVSMLFSLL
jgi:hypothetical protein